MWPILTVIPVRFRPWRRAGSRGLLPEARPVWSAADDSVAVQVPGALTPEGSGPTLGRVRVLIRNPRRREVEIDGGRDVRALLRELGLSEESHLVVRGDEVLTRDDWIAPADRVEIISAVSGGAA